MRTWMLGVLAVAASCSHQPAEGGREQAARLRASLEKHYARYTAGIDAENSLVRETLDWLNGTAITAPRTQAVAEARSFMDRWARVYFVPREMHGELRFHTYSSEEVRAVQQRMLNGLKRRYFELHDFQRYAQYASESAMHQTPAGRLPRQLEEFRSRLQSRAPAEDEIGPLIASL